MPSSVKFIIGYTGFTIALGIFVWKYVGTVDALVTSQDTPVVEQEGQNPVGEERRRRP